PSLGSDLGTGLGIRPLTAADHFVDNEDEQQRAGVPHQCVVGSHLEDRTQSRCVKEKKGRRLMLIWIVHQVDGGKEQNYTGNGSQCPKKIASLRDAEMQQMAEPERPIQREGPKRPFEIDIGDLSPREQPYPIDLIGRFQHAAKTSSVEDHGDAASERYSDAPP